MKDWQNSWVPIDGTKRLSGGQGTVVKVINTISGIEGALKLLHTSHQTNSERRQRMAREVVSLERIQCDGISEVIDHNMEFVDDPNITLFLVTHWINGKTLQQTAGGKPLSIDRTLQIMTYLASTLGCCHSSGTIHRDIKPENIIIEQHSQLPVLVDFGLAWSEKHDDNIANLSSINQELGNRFFRLPDLSIGESKHDVRTDITFLVGVLFFLLTGVAPRNLIDSRGMPPHESLSNRIPEDILSDARWIYIRRIFQVGFQPSIDHRFQSASDLIQRLTEIEKSNFTKNNTVNYQNEANLINELLQSAISRSTQLVEESMYNASKKLLEKIGNMAQDIGLGVSTGDYISISRYVECHFTLHVPRRGISSKLIRHRVELEGQKRGIIIASYRFEMENNENKTIEYYRGPSADTERLEEEMLLQASEMLKITVDDLHRRLEDALK